MRIAVGLDDSAIPSIFSEISINLAVPLCFEVIAMDSPSTQTPVDVRDKSIPMNLNALMWRDYYANPINTGKRQKTQEQGKSPYPALAPITVLRTTSLLPFPSVLCKS